jgi:hypothetical protein
LLASPAPSAVTKITTPPLSRTPALLLHPPERAHPKPGKHQCEANCNRDSPETDLPRLILRVFMRPGHSAAGCDHQKYQPRNLQPQLMEDVAQSACCGCDRAAQGAYSSAPFRLLARDPRHYPQLLCGRNLIHDSILAASGATMTQSARQRNRSGGAGIQWKVALSAAAERIGRIRGSATQATHERTRGSYQ